MVRNEEWRDVTTFLSSCPSLFLILTPGVIPLSLVLFFFLQTMLIPNLTTDISVCTSSSDAWIIVLPSEVVQSLEPKNEKKKETGQKEQLKYYCSFFWVKSFVEVVLFMKRRETRDERIRRLEVLSLLFLWLELHHQIAIPSSRRFLFVSHWAVFSILVYCPPLKPGFTGQDNPSFSCNVIKGIDSVSESCVSWIEVQSLFQSLEWQ